MENFGQKFLGVESGGSLEIHGPQKTSWTRLAKPLVPKAKAHLEERKGGSHKGSPYKGFVLFEFSGADGILHREINGIVSAEQMDAELAKVGDGQYRE